MRLTYSVKPVLRQDKKKADGLIPIYYSIRVGPYASRIPTGKYTLLKDWNVKDNCPKNNSKENQLLGSFLSQKISGWKLFMLQQEMAGNAVTFNVAAGYFQENTKVTFYSFFEEQLELWQESKRPCTLKSYKSTLNVLREYNKSITFQDLTYQFIQRLDLYLGKVRGNSIGGKFTRHKCLKAIIHQAIKHGHMTLEQNPYRHFKIKASKGKRNFLSVSEVKKLMDYDLPEKELMLVKTKDLFLFSCLTGLRYGDIMNLKWNNVKSDPDMIALTMSKTSKDIKIPLNDYAKELLNKYGKHTIKTSQGAVFPHIDNQVINRNLKGLMELVGINKLISFHCARHTFASNLIECGVNVLYIKDLLGHSSLVETQQYTKSLTGDLISTMQDMANMYSHAV